METFNRARLEEYHLGRGNRGGSEAFLHPSQVTASGKGHVTGRVGLDPSAIARDFAYFKQEGRGNLLVTEGYEFMEAGRQRGWRSMSSWGDPGWDLGDWPYVVFESKTIEGQRVLVSHVEGDLDFYVFPNEELFRAAVTYLFIWYAVAGGRDYAKGWDAEDASTWPENVHGPYRYMKEKSA